MSSGTSGGMRSLLEGEPSRILREQSLPIIFGYFIWALQSVANAYFLGRLGSTALAAIGLAEPILGVVRALVTGISIGVTTVVAQSLGRGDIELARRRATDALILAVVVGVVAGGSLIAALPWLLARLGARPPEAEEASRFLMLWLGGSFLMATSSFSTAVSRAFGDSKSTGVMLLATAALNILFDPLLIFGIGPFHRFGMAGAGIATVIGWLIPLGWHLWLIQRPAMRCLAMRWPSRQELVASARAILGVGIPACGNLMAGTLSILVLTTLVTDHGTAAVGAFAVGNRVLQLIGVVLIGTAAAVGPFVAQNWGAGKLERVSDGLQSARRFALVFGAAAWLCLGPGGGLLARLFSSDAAVVETLRTFFWIVPMGFGAYGLVLMTCTALAGLGRPIVSLSLEGSRAFLFVLPLAFVLNYYWGLAGIFAGMVLGNLLAVPSAFVVLNRRLLLEPAGQTGLPAPRADVG